MTGARAYTADFDARLPATSGGRAARTTPYLGRWCGYNFAMAAQQSRTTDHSLPARVRLMCTTAVDALRRRVSHVRQWSAQDDAYCPPSGVPSDTPWHLQLTSVWNSCVFVGLIVRVRAPRHHGEFPCPDASEPRPVRQHTPVPHRHMHLRHTGCTAHHRACAPRPLFIIVPRAHQVRRTAACGNSTSINSSHSQYGVRTSSSRQQSCAVSVKRGHAAESTT